MKATCIRRTRIDETLTHTYYRVSGKGLQVQKLGPPAYYRDVVVSASVRMGKPEAALFAANKNGTIKHTSRGSLVTLWGGEYGTQSASRVLKNAGVTEITPCPGTAPSVLDARRRSRRLRRK